ncbi:MAG: magnesium transporter [Candidatus Hydrogenedentes bacterium]|nr:magnesium transporter [Candidatus Hydrogenedentota bacterium]
MTNGRTGESWEQIEAIVGQGDAAALDSFLDTLSPAEVARAVSRLDDESQAAVLTLLEPGDAADLLEELTDAQGADILEELSALQAAAIVDEMESDERADVLAELDDEDAEAILAKMDPEEARDARQLLAYPEDTAGGLMVTEFLCFSQSLSVADVLDDLRRNVERYSDYSVQYAYVLGDTGTVVGVLRLHDLVLSPSNAPLTSVMIANPLYALVTTPLAELEQLFDRYTFTGLPVVDEKGQMVGVVRRADVEEAQGERAEEALMRFGGIIGGEELRSMSVASRAFRRLSWLIVNLALSLGAASVILVYKDTVEHIIELAFFIPVIGNMSGCSGNQAVAVSIRELTLGLIQPRDFVRVLIKEAQVGVLNGLALGLLLGTVAFIWLHDPVFSLVVGGALAANTLVALGLGGLVPLALRKLKADPALAAPLAVTTIADMCGFFLVLSMACAFVVGAL